MILKNAEAQAIYDAMCSLNNVGGTLHARIETASGVFKVWGYMGGQVRIARIANHGPQDERYLNQDAFKQAYFLT